MELLILFGIAIAAIFGLVVVEEISEFVWRNEDKLFRNGE